jgi:hypothetical protein
LFESPVRNMPVAGRRCRLDTLYRFFAGNPLSLRRPIPLSLSLTHTYTHKSRNFFRALPKMLTVITAVTAMCMCYARVIPFHAMNAYRSRGIAPLILNLDTRWSRVINVPRLLCARKKTGYPVNRLKRPQPVCMFRKQKFVTGYRTRDRPSRRLVGDTNSAFRAADA